jgi:hypothetical protein
MAGTIFYYGRAATIKTADASAEDFSGCEGDMAER